MENLEGGPGSRARGVAAHLYVEFGGSGADPDRLQHAVAALVAAHPMLRSRFLADGTQQIMPARN